MNVIIVYFNRKQRTLHIFNKEKKLSSHNLMLIKLYMMLSLLYNLK